MKDHEMERVTNEYNKYFASYDHYKKHPQMMPFIGKY
jgi:hypothetical protein